MRGLILPTVYVLTLWAVVMLAACAADRTEPLPVEPRPTVPPSYAEVRARVLHDLRSDPLMRVSSYALAVCDTRDAWLPAKGPIADIQFWRALTRERWAKNTCADRHRALRAQVKAILGVIRERE